MGLSGCHEPAVSASDGGHTPDTRHLARLRVWGEWPQWHWHWPVVVSPGSPVTARGHPSEVSRGLLMTLVMTSLIILCSHLSWPGPRVSISADDQHCDDRCQGTAELMSRCHSLVPTPGIVTDSHSPRCMVSVCLNGPTVRLVTANTGGLSVVTGRYLVSSQTEKPITTLYPLQPLTLACETHWYLRFLAVPIILKF